MKDNMSMGWNYIWEGVDHRWATLIIANLFVIWLFFFSFDTLMRAFKCFHNLANSLVSKWTSKIFRSKSNCQSKVFFWKPKLKNHQFQIYEIKIKEPSISWNNWQFLGQLFEFFKTWESSLGILVLITMIICQN